VVAAALEQGFTAATLLADAPTSYPMADGRLWEPRNYDGVYRGTVTVREALSGSINLATLDLAERTGLRRIDAVASELGIESPLEPHLGTALGASDVGLLELTAAYAAFANGGWRVRPHLVTAVLDAEGGAQEFHRDERKRVLRPETAYLVTSILMDAVTQGTGRSLVERGWTRPAAGKTGTSSQGKDAWFIGYTPELLAGVWTGEDLPKAALASGAGSALPVWEAFMTAALADYPESEFPEPEGLVGREVDIRTGALARSGCPEKRRELFRAGTEPTAKCPVHVGGVRGLFQRLFGGD
jgi:membrane carboxypeptidase/penicillin-binding protein